MILAPTSTLVIDCAEIVTTAGVLRESVAGQAVIETGAAFAVKRGSQASQGFYVILG